MIFFGIFDTKNIDINIFFVYTCKKEDYFMHDTILYDLDIKKVYSIFTLNT